MKLRNLLLLLVTVLTVFLIFYIKDSQKKRVKLKNIATACNAQLNIYKEQLKGYTELLSDYKDKVAVDKGGKSRLEVKSQFIADILPFYEAQLAKNDVSYYLNAQKMPSANEKVKFCIVIPSYNNIKYATQNLNSVFNQDYHNWRMIYMDDASNDGMSELVKKIKQESNLPDNKFTVNRYKERMRRASYSFYYAANNFCKDEEVMLFVDGDDMLATPRVLNKLAEVYQDNKIWVTYGHHMYVSSGELCPITRQATDSEFDNMRFSKWWGYSHLRTAYTWLFKKIKPDDLKYKGEFLSSSWDMAIMYPMLEMAGKDRVKYISDVMYLYRSHPNNDSKLYSKEQNDLDKYIRNLPSYELIK